MEWNRQLIEMAKNFGVIFTLVTVKNYDFCEPDVSRFNYFVSTGIISMHALKHYTN